MENFGPPFSTTSTSSSSPSSTLFRSSSQLSHNLVFSYLPPNPYSQQPPYFPCPPPICSSPVPSSAAMNSRMVRQRRSNILRTKKAARATASFSSSSSSSSSSSRLVVERDPSSVGSETQNEQHLFQFCMLDNKKSRLLFKKELKNSDVESFGRIVLPKKEAEKYLPSLSDKRHRAEDQGCAFNPRVGYWTNNKSRMYLLENTGDFVGKMQ